jgi:hypothetical protein
MTPTGHDRAVGWQSAASAQALWHFAKRASYGLLPRIGETHELVFTMRPPPESGDSKAKNLLYTRRSEVYAIRPNSRTWSCPLTRLSKLLKLCPAARLDQLASSKLDAKKANLPWISCV